MPVDGRWPMDTWPALSDGSNWCGMDWVVQGSLNEQGPGMYGM